MSVDTVYAQIVNGQDMNIALFGQAAEEIIGRADTTNLGTLPLSPLCLPNPFGSYALHADHNAHYQYI